MEWVEASGKSMSDAKEIVLDLLGVAEDDAEIIILSEPKAGLFGRVRGEARVRARVRPVVPRPKRSRKPRSDRGRGTRDGNRSSGGNGKAAGGDRAKRSSSGSNGKGNGGGQAEAGAGPSRSGSSGAAPSGRPRRGGRAAASGADGPPGQGKQTGASSGDSEDTMEESLTLEQQGEAAKEFVAGLVREFGLDAEVTFAELDEDTVQVSATGDDLGLLVGPRGATLAAVQDLTRTFVQRQSENRTDRILVDVGGYRQKRAAALGRFAEGIVAEVKSSGEERSLEPMSPADRKVVHDAVNEMDGVETRSEGTEPSRYVVIQPSA
ncbi:MAG: RNA-binding cell elongation regulator Jag/EloR [Acidimicrobiales bacterium]